MALINKDTTVNISNWTIVRTILWVMAAILTYKFLAEVAHVLTLIFIAFFLALAMNPVIGWLSQQLKIGSRVRATAVAYLFLVALLAGFLLLTIPPIVNETRDFVREAPTVVANFQSQDSSVAQLAERYDINRRLSEAAVAFASDYSNFGNTILDTTKRVVSVVLSLIVVLILTFMMLVEGPKWFKLLVGNLPKTKRDHYERLARKMSKSVSGYVLGQLILAVTAGFFSLVALLIASSIFNVSINAIALAAIVVVLGLIPMIGNTIAAVIVVLVCLLSSVPLAITMGIYFIIYQQLENATFQPYVQARQNALTPLLVFVAALIGISIAGFIGAFAAIPVAASIKILLEDRFGGHLAPTRQEVDSK